MHNLPIKYFLSFHNIFPLKRMRLETQSSQPEIAPIMWLKFEYFWLQNNCIFLLADHEVRFIVPCVANKSIFWPPCWKKIVCDTRKTLILLVWLLPSLCSGIKLHTRKINYFFPSCTIYYIYEGIMFNLTQKLVKSTTSHLTMDSQSNFSQTFLLVYQYQNQYFIILILTHNSRVNNK